MANKIRHLKWKLKCVMQLNKFIRWSCVEKWNIWSQVLHLKGRPVCFSCDSLLVYSQKWNDKQICMGFSSFYKKVIETYLFLQLNAVFKILMTTSKLTKLNTHELLLHDFSDSLLMLLLLRIKLLFIVWLQIIYFPESFPLIYYQHF